MARKIGLDIDNVHAPADNPEDLWRDSLRGEDYLAALISCVEDCRIHTIPTVVIHITSLSPKAPPSAIGLERIKTLVDRAQKEQVFIALENMGEISHLDHIFENIDSEWLGFCYDSGHEHLIYPKYPAGELLNRYGDKLLAVHLNDNFARGDTHLLPFDGRIDWAKVVEALSKCKKLPYLTLEADFERSHEESSMYEGLSAEEFLASAYGKLSHLMEM